MILHSAYEKPLPSDHRVLVNFNRFSTTCISL